MAMTFKNKTAQGVVDISGDTPVSTEVLILTGTSSGTVVKSLELTTGNESSYVDIIRKDGLDVDYSTIHVEMKANDYLVLWEGFFVIPNQHKLYLKADSNLVQVVANVIEMT